MTSCDSACSRIGTTFWSRYARIGSVFLLLLLVPSAPLAAVLPPEIDSPALPVVDTMAELEAFLATMRETFPDDASFRMPVRMIHDQQITELVAELIGRGFDTPSLKLILGGNWMRVASQVWPTRLTRT